MSFTTKIYSMRSKVREGFVTTFKNRLIVVSGKVSNS
jgi:hypothetical protein